MGDGVIGQVAAAHDEGTADLGHQEVVQGCVGEHHAEVAHARGDGIGDGRLRPAWGKDDRPCH